MAEQSQVPMATGEFERRCLTCGKAAPPTGERETPMTGKGDFPTGEKGFSHRNSLNREDREPWTDKLLGEIPLGSKKMRGEK